jgi:hypothetical protein
VTSIIVFYFKFSKPPNKKNIYVIVLLLKAGIIKCNLNTPLTRNLLCMDMISSIVQASL